MQETAAQDPMNKLRELCVTMQEMAVEIEKIETDLADFKKSYDQLRTVTIPAKLEELGLRNATFEGIGRVQVAADLQCSTAAGRKGDAMQWLKDSGYADMIREDYNASSMKALVKRLLVDGVEIPDFMNVYPFQRASIVKA
jgi:hypothetical protein